MKDGAYVIELSADGFDQRGLMGLDRCIASGQGVDFQVRGEMSAFGPFLSGNLIFTMSPGKLRNQAVRNVFAVEMTGMCGGAEFFLHGVGPFGIVIDILGNEAAIEMVEQSQFSRTYH